MRREWILARGDVEEYEGREAQPIDDGYLTFTAANRARVKDVGRLEEFPAERRAVLRAKPGSCVTQLHYARRGIITPEMEFIAIRENLGREAAWETDGAPRDSLLHQHAGQSFGAQIPRYVTAEFVREEVALRERPSGPDVDQDANEREKIRMDPECDAECAESSQALRSVTSNVVPAPGRLSTVTLPPIASIL